MQYPMCMYAACTQMCSAPHTGPVLFLIYVNDIGNIIVNSKEKLMLFADDSNAFVVNKTLKELKHNAEILMLKLNAWFNSNK